MLDLGNEAAPSGAVVRGDLGVAAEALLPELSAKARTGIKEFLKVIDEGRALLDQGVVKPEKGRTNRKKNSGDGEELNAGEGLSVLVVKLVQDSGIAAYHQLHDEVSGNQRLSNLQELANAASLYQPNVEGLLEFLEHIELDRSLGDSVEGSGSDGSTVTLITFHNTKGLEFRRVIMTGLEQGMFPREDKKDEDLEEERRLFYVGATRAMDELYLTSCAMRRMFGRPQPMEASLFLREIDKSNVRVLGDAPYGFNMPAGRAAPFNAPNTKYDDDEGGPRWQRGDRLYHDDHGYGAVIEVRDSDEGPVVRVQFETGKELRFLSNHQGSRFMKLGKGD
jgi:DNA helicase-2/ATP-dependent DNA helicase PcrA